MADADLREVLAKFVPDSVLDDAIEAIKETEVAPEWWRSEMAKVAPDAKEAKELRAELESIKSAPKRAEAYQRIGLKGDLPKYARDWLDQNIPLDKLDDLEFIASKVKEGGYEVDLSEVQQPEKTGAEAISEFMTSTPGTPARSGAEAARDAFFADLEKVPDDNQEAITAVLAKYGVQAPPES